MKIVWSKFCKVKLLTKIKLHLQAMGLENVVLVCFFLVSYVYCTSVKDVILMHGLFEHPSDMFVMRDFIKKVKYVLTVVDISKHLHFELFI